MITIFYNSLGILAGLTILLIGFSWFTNFKLYERDKNAIKQEMLLKLQEEISSLKKETLTNIESKFKNYDSAFDKKIADAKTKIASSLDYRISMLEKEQKEYDYKFAETDARYWEFINVKSNAISGYIKMLGIAKELEREYRIGSNLEKIDELLSEEADLHTSDNIKLNSLLTIYPQNMLL